MSLLILNLIFFSVSCKNENKEQDDSQMQENVRDTITTTNNTQVESRTYTGDISTINQKANGDEDVSGNVEIRVEGDLMRIAVTAEGLAPDIMHMQHLQLSGTGENLRCPGNDADANSDGIVDVTEISGGAQGIHMIPLHMGPSSLEMNADTYPKTNVNGELQFSTTISLDSLQTAVRQKFGVQELDLTQVVYIIQGVHEGASIPQTAQTLTGVAIHQSVPVGCAKLED